MAIHVVWDDSAHSIIRWDFDQEWDWNDFWQAFDTSLEFGIGSPHRVDVIPNVTQTKRLPIGALGAFKTVDARLPEFVRLVVVAGQDSMTRLMIKTFAQINGIDSWRTALTLDEARAIIIKDRQENG